MEIISTEAVVSPAPKACPDLEKYSQYWQSGNRVVQFGLADYTLAYLYQEFQKQGVLKWLFYEREFSLYEFMGLFLKPETNTLGAFWENPTTLKWEIAGFSFFRDITTMGGKFLRADVGQAFLRNLPPEASPIGFARMMMEIGFDRLGLSVISGLTPARNRASVAFAKRIGFSVCGPIPGGVSWYGQLEPAYLSSMTKIQWEQISPWGSKYYGGS